ncbi:type II toxin-antitoxin system Phd/YefM family antitoxin [Aggregatilinea lenta]|uniref:type II toxin-antitoxin system Phd/YefM family antitoxin n=1 Tax=Aggregatilinea lenta TaxID=913108 RepID=UPI000E5BE9AF|nr:toxin-antitoxin (TA) system antitoxin [Aggregatilinea lenta]
MGAKSIEVQEAEANLKELLDLVREGTEIVLMDGDKPLARLAPASVGKRIPGLHPGGWISEDFDAPLPDEFWLGSDAQQ